MKYAPEHEFRPPSFEGVPDYVERERSEWKESRRVYFETECLRKQREDAQLKGHKSQITYSDHLAQEIYERISSGELLTVICNDEHMPLARNIIAWLGKYEEFKQLYNDALQKRLKIFEEDVVRIADDISRDTKVNKKGEAISDSSAVTRDKLRVEVRFRHLRAYKPERWSEQSTVTMKHEDEFDPSKLNDEELEAKIADIDAKSNIVNKYDRA
jgi:hypothetical protein